METRKAPPYLNELKRWTFEVKCTLDRVARRRVEVSRSWMCEIGGERRRYHDRGGYFRHEREWTVHFEPDRDISYGYTRRAPGRIRRLAERSDEPRCVCMACL